MPKFQIYNPSGLDVRSNDLTRPQNKASDLRNVEKDSNGNIRTRWGLDKLLDQTIYDLARMKTRDEILVFGAPLVSLYRVVNDSSLEIIPPMGNVFPTSTAIGKPFEYNGNLYWNYTDGSADLHKYDGGRIYRAGVPKPKITNTPAAGAFYARVILSFTDPAGNVTWGDYVQFDNVDANAFFTFDPITDTEYNGFMQRFADVPAPQIFSGAGTKVVNVTSHNYNVGEKVALPILTVADGTYRRVLTEITATTANTISLDMNYLVAGESHAVLNDAGIEQGWRANVFISSEPTFGYERVSTIGNEFGLNNESASFSLTMDTIQTGEFLTQVYDDTKIRILPPRFKYLTLFEDIVVGGNLLSGTTLAQLENTSVQDIIGWSDVTTRSNGSTIETWLVDNFRVVGDNNDGEITGLFGNDDSLIVHKEEQAYYINGDFVTNLLRIRKAMTNGIGGASHKSIIEVDGGSMFLAKRGFYLSIAGQVPQEMSDEIEPLFTGVNVLGISGIDPTVSQSVRDILREKVYIAIKTSDTSKNERIIVCYDYYWKEWYLHDDVPCKNGLVILDDGMYMSDGNSLYKRNQSITRDWDLSVSPTTEKQVNDYWSSSWWVAGQPMLRKKFTKLFLASIDSSKWTCRMRNQTNWNDSSFLSDVQFEVGGTSNPVEDIKFNVGSQVHGMRVELSRTSKKDIPMVITGLEVEFNDGQKLGKGGD